MAKSKVKNASKGLGRAFIAKRNRLAHSGLLDFKKKFIASPVRPRRYVE